MSLPQLGQYFEGGYQSDDGTYYQAGFCTGQYPSDQPALDAAGAPSLPHFVTPRYWDCQYSDGENIVLVRVPCPLPFSQIADPNRPLLTTSDGVTLRVLARVGEEFAPYAA